MTREFRAPCSNATKSFRANVSMAMNAPFRSRIWGITYVVADIDATAAAVMANGGKIIMPRCEIPTVGWLIKVQDPEGNAVCVKQPAVASAG